MIATANGQLVTDAGSVHSDNAEEAVLGVMLRENEIVACISDGLTNRQISERLNVSVRTVETHRERLMRKFDLPDANALRSFAAARVMLADVNAIAVSTES